MLLSKKNKTMAITAAALAFVVVLIAAAVRATKTGAAFGDSFIAQVKSIFGFGE